MLLGLALCIFCFGDFVNLASLDVDFVNLASISLDFLLFDLDFTLVFFDLLLNSRLLDFTIGSAVLLVGRGENISSFLAF